MLGSIVCNHELSVNKDLDLRRLQWRALRQVTGQDLGKRQRREALGCACEFLHRPPAKAIHDLHLNSITHPWLQPADMEDVILLSLTDALPRPIERVLSSPDHGPDHEVFEAKLLAEFTPECRFDGLARFEPASRGYPERVTARWVPDT